MNALIEKAKIWLNELGIRTEDRPTNLAVNRDDIDALCGIGVVYEEFLTELRSALGTNKFYWEQKDREWLYLNCW
jgi:hypothetical protein